jgi:septation ring formation regulator EzrA
VDDLEDLEILVKKALEDLGDEGFELEVEGLEDRIERIENQINEIITSEPYIYNEILESKEKIEGLHNQLSDEYKDYETYLETLKKSLNELLIGNGISTTWKLN